MKQLLSQFQAQEALKFLSRLFSKPSLVKSLNKDETLLISAKLLTDADLSHAITYGNEFLSRIGVVEFECDNSVMRKLLNQEVSPYEAYLLGKDLHRNILEILEEESLIRHQNKEKS